MARSAARCAPRACRQLFVAIVSAAVADRLLVRSPAAGVKLPRREGSVHVPLATDDVRSLAGAIEPRLSHAVVVAALTGLRQGELFGITEDRIGWLKRELRVDRQIVTSPQGEPRFGPVKTSRSVRTVPLSDDALAALAQQVEQHGLGEDGLVFHRDGKPWRRNRAATAMRRAAEAADIDARWHGLRHYCASVLIREGVSVTGVAAMLGHSPAECLKTYAAWWPSEHEILRSAMRRAWANETSDDLSPHALQR
jgi:integrase